MLRPNIRLRVTQARTALFNSFVAEVQHWYTRYKISAHCSVQHWQQMVDELSAEVERLQPVGGKKLRKAKESLEFAEATLEQCSITLARLEALTLENIDARLYSAALRGILGRVYPTTALTFLTRGVF